MATQPLFLLGKFHGQRNLAGYSPWGHKEWDTTEHMVQNSFFTKQGHSKYSARLVVQSLGRV